MRIGIDIDDTMTETYDIFMKKICEIYNLDYETLFMQAMNYDYLHKKYPKAFEMEIFEKYVPNVKLKKDVKKVINKLSKKHEIIIITARNKNEYKMPYNVACNYLIKNNIHFDEMFVEIYDKGKCCYDNKIDLFIDDSVRNCLSVDEYGIDTIIYDNIFNKDCNLKRFDNWLDIYDYIERKNDGKNSN